MNCNLPYSSVHGILENNENTGVGCDFLLQENLLYLEIEPGSPKLQVDSLLSEPPGKPPFSDSTEYFIPDLHLEFLSGCVQIRSVAQSCLTLCNPKVSKYRANGSILLEPDGK